MTRPELDAFLALTDARENLRDARARHDHAVYVAGLDPTPNSLANCDRTAADIGRAMEVLRAKRDAWSVAVGIVDLPGDATVAA